MKYRAKCCPNIHYVPYNVLHCHVWPVKNDCVYIHTHPLLSQLHLMLGPILYYKIIGIGASFLSIATSNLWVSQRERERHSHSEKRNWTIETWIRRDFPWLDIHENDSFRGSLFNVSLIGRVIDWINVMLKDQRRRGRRWRKRRNRRNPKPEFIWISLNFLSWTQEILTRININRIKVRKEMEYEYK